MELTWQTFAIVCPLVFLGGFMDAVAGGGGIITLPAYMFAGVPIHMAYGTNKFGNSFGTAIATFNYGRGGFIHWKIFRTIGAVSSSKTILLCSSSQR